MALELSIVTPRGPVFHGEVEGVVLPGAEGDFGVLERHERFLSPLRIGEVAIRGPAGESYAAISDGFAAVEEGSVTVLVESCEVAEQIDVARAELARDRARQGLAQLGADADRERYLRFAAALRRAETRLAVSRKS